MTTTPQPPFTVRPMKREEVALIREWANAEGWNPGTHDGDCFYHTDPGGFFLGELDGEPVACISCVAYDESFGFLGQYIVRPGFRGRGYGIEVWRAGMAHLGSRNVGLDGVLRISHLVRGVIAASSTSGRSLKPVEASARAWTGVASHSRTISG